MCGICGRLQRDGVDLESIVKMNRLASHRGPDGEGYWLYDGRVPTGTWIGEGEVPANMARKGLVGLGNQRLSIIDLSEAGLQPMSSPSRQQWIIFNGEIYNYLELRAELKQLDHHFRTETDTEVILAAYDQWGVSCFSRFNGMWGLAIVDLNKRSLILSRDRLGVKPLYYWKNAVSLAFASEIKQFMELPGFLPKANLEAIIEYIDTGYEIPPATFFQNIKVFPPGCFAEIALDHPGELSAQAYWAVEDFSPINTTELAAEEQLRFLFEDAVKLRLRSDVPVGVCLSGGLDSSAIYGQIQQLTDHSEATHAFTASFREKQFDESPFVDLVLDSRNGKNFSTYPNAQGFLDDFTEFIYHHDEPPGGLSQYAAWTVMRLARQHQVPVLLNGQGADELFGGYWPAYYLYLRQSFSKSPWLVISQLAGSLAPEGNPELIRQIPPHLLQFAGRKNRSNRKVLSDGLKNYNLNGNQNWAAQAQQLQPEKYRWSEIKKIHLPRLLKWDDRNSMAFSIEGRYPFLDYRLVEFAMKLPPQMNFHNGWNKYTMRKALGHLLPPPIQWRRSKIGFVTPQSEWLQTTLKPVLLDWVNGPLANFQGMINKPRLYQLTRKLLSSKKIHPMNEDQHLLFRLFALDKWFEVYNVGVE